MTRIWYEIEYRAGDRWFPTMDGDGHIERHDNIASATRALSTCSRLTSWRIAKVEETRTPLVID
jgi:hypothetical protein